MTTLVDVLRRHAATRGEDTACLYLGEDEQVRDRVTFGQLDERARAIAARLQGLGASGSPVLALYPQGLEFISAFFGCLYAGVIVVPLPVPRHEAALAQFVGIQGDLQASLVLSTAATIARLKRMEVAGSDDVTWLATEETGADLARAWRAPAIGRDAVAYLQYTSGSTSSRKGVAIGHGNVIANVDALGGRFEHHGTSVSVNWLPHTHDLGLVSGILQPIVYGHLNVLLSPAAFVQQPIRWLNAISRYRGTYTNSPNFGYDLCVRQTTPEQRAALDLASWEVALNGAEPVRQQTIEAFAATFEQYGLRPNAMYPAYGLAEATLMVSGGRRLGPPVALSLLPAGLERDRIIDASPEAGGRPAIGCGHVIPSTVVAIVDATTRRPCDPDVVGEIWVSGPGVAAGYWQHDDETRDTFKARLADDDGREYLRTGDLGFMRDGQLFITGRLKDLIIVRGSNHYPQDIELTVEQCHAAFRPGCGAAFAVEVAGSERLVVVFELEREHLRSTDHAELARLARRAIAEQHDLHLFGIALLKTGSVPRTPSGKIQRRQCRADFLGGKLTEVWREVGDISAELERSSAIVPNATAPGLQTPAAPAARAATTSAADLNAWLRSYAADRLNSHLMDERRSIAPHVILDFGNRGVLGLQVSRAMGGLGFGYREALQVVQQLGAIDLTISLMTVVHNVLGIRPVERHATPAVRDEWLPRLAAGRDLAAFAITEPGAGSNPQAIVSTATPDGLDGWRLDGRKSWSGTAGWASLINVFVQNRRADGSAHGISGFAVPRDTKGLRMGPEALTLGMRGMVQNTIYFESASVTRGQALGEIGAGMAVAQDAMLQGRLAIGAACVGAMQRCLQLGVRYATRRSVSTGRLVENPVFLDRAGMASAALTALGALVERVATRLDEGADVPVDVFTIVKVAGSEWLYRTADDLVQFLGGRGYIETNVAAQLLRDARVTRILEGPTEALGMHLGSRVVNDRTALRRFIAEDLGSPAVAAQLDVVAVEIEERCASRGRRLGDELGSRRYAYALLGQIATDAVVTAAVPADAPAHCRVWAEQQLESAIAAARACSSERAFHLEAPTLRRVVDGYTATIGDVEQTLPGEDHELDGMLRREHTEPLARMHEPHTTPPRATRRIIEPDIAPSVVSTLQPTPTATVERLAPSAAEIEGFIVQWVARELKMPETAVDPARSFFDYGLDSVTTVMLTAALESRLGVEISPEAAYDVPVIRRFAEALNDLARSGTPASTAR